MTDAEKAPWPAPAKINLFVHVLGRRDDGYHEIQTLFQFLDVGDRLYFRHRSDGRIRRTGGAAGIAETEDLVVTAAHRLREQAGIEAGVEIQLDKQLPVGGGLGGGSSDAATTLHALNHLWDLNLDMDALCALGAELGSDVPVFVRGQAAWAEGRGEQLTPVDPPEACYVVVQPPCSVSTAAIYGDEDLRRDSEPIDLSTFLADGARNDFQPVVSVRHELVGEALRWLACFGEARVTGTGACVFVRVSDQHEGQRVIERLPEDWKGFVARGLNRSPLLDRLASLRAGGGS